MEDEILAALGLSELQKEKVAEFRAELAKVNEEFRKLNRTGTASEIAKKGGEINAMVRTSMQHILTKEQYAKYTNAWDERLGLKGSASGAAAAPVSPRGAAAAGS